MKTVAELRKMRARAVDEMAALVDAADKREDVGMTEAEEARFVELKAEAERLQMEAERRAELTGLLQGLDGPETRQETSQAPAFHRRPTKDTAEAIMCRYIRSRGMDPGAGLEMNAAAQEEYRHAGLQRDIELGVRDAVDGFEPGEYRASNDTIMNITTAADGGNLVPTGHYNRIIERKDEAGLAAVLPLRPIGGKGTTVNVPVDDEADGEFVTKAEQVDALTNTFDRDAPAVGKVAMTLVKYTKKIVLTDELQYDHDSDLMAHLERRVGIGLRKTDNNLIVTEALADGTAALTLDAVASIGIGEIPELVYLQADGYEDDAHWVMRKATFGHLMQKTGNPFQLAATPGGGRNGELWGFPVATTGKMPAIGGGYKSLLFGDFNYMGVRRMPGLTMLVDPYTTDGVVTLKYYYRVDFEVLQAAAIIYATHPTA